MEFSRNLVDCAQQLNTKGCCFLCLDDVEENKINNGEDRHLFSIRCLLRHLRITSFNKQIFTGKDMEVDLCETCENTLKGLTNVLKELEKAQMRMNYFLERINKTISSSKKDSKRVQVYSKRMTDDPVTLAQLASVDKLRNELAVKSHENKIGRIATVKLKRISKEVIKIKQAASQNLTTKKEVENSFNHEDSDFDLDHSPEILEPLADPSILMSTRDDESPQPIKKEEVNGSSAVDTAGEDPVIKFETEIEKGRKRYSRGIWYIKDKGTGMYQCRKCNKTYRSQQAVHAHYQSVHLNKRFKCDICNISSYATNYDLKVHQKTCQETLEERLVNKKKKEYSKFICNSCGKKFTTQGSLQTHGMTVHKNINRYSCDLCSKKFTKLFNLKTHRDAVHFGKVLSCRFCQNQYKSKSSLWHHQILCKGNGKIKTELVNQQ